MLKSEDVVKIKNQIFEYLKNDKGLTIFFGTIKTGERDLDIHNICYWKNNDEYQKFFDVAKNLGIKLIYYDEATEDDILENNNKGIGQFVFEFEYSGVIHSLLMQSDDVRNFDEEEDSEEESQDSEEPKIDEEYLCKRCKKEHKASYDPDYCYKCIEILRNEAKETANKLAEDISNDPKFIEQPNATARRIFVEDNYGEEKKKNKFFALVKLSERAYTLTKMKK